MDVFTDVLKDQYSTISPMLIVTIVLVVLLVIQAYTKVKPRLTPRTIKKEVLKEHKDIKTTWLTKLRVGYYLPSATAAVVLLVIAAVLFFISTNLGVEVTAFKETNRLQNLIAVLAGLGVILFAFLIFVAEQTRENRDHARILLRQGLIFPLSTMYVTILLFFVSPHIREAVIYVVLLIGGFVLWSMYRVFKTLFDENLLEEKVKQYTIDENIRKNLVSSMLVRLSKNQQLEYLDKSKYRIEYNPFMNDEGIPLKMLSKKGQAIDDINLDQLERMLAKLETVLNKKGVSILKEKKFKEPELKSKARLTQSSNPKLESAEPETLPSVKIFCIRLVGDLVGKSEVVLALDRQNTNDEIIKEMTSVCNDFIPGVFKLKQGNGNKNFIRLVETQQENAAIAIAANAILPLQQALTTFEAVVQSFNELLVPMGSYSREEALKERGSIFERWDFLEQLGDNYEDLMEEAVKVGNFKAIKTIARSAYRILRDSVNYRNHLIFLQMIYFVIHLYDYGSRSEDEQIRTYLQDRSSRYIDEIVSYQLSDLTKDGDIKGYTQYKDFVTNALQAYLHLLRRSVDLGDLAGFKSVLSGQRSIIQRIDRGYDFRTVDYTEEEMENQINKISDELKQSGVEIIFGISTWALNRAQKANFDEDNRNKILETALANLPDSFGDLTNRFVELSKGNAPDGWGWSSWGAPMTGEVYSVDDETPLVKVYLLKILLIGHSNLSLSAVKSMIDGYGDDNDAVYEIQRLFKRFKTMLEEDNQWVEKVLGQEKYQQLPGLLTVVDSIIKEADDAFERIVAARPISQNEVKKFKQQLMEKYEKHGNLQKILGSRKVFRNQKSYDEDAKQYGIYQIDDKEIFFEKWHVGYSHWGEAYGERFAEAEEKLVYDFLMGKMDKEEAEYNQVAPSIESLLGDDSIETVELILTNMHDFELEDIDWGNYTFEQKGYPRTGSHFGDLKVGRRRIPMYYAGHTADDDFVTFLNASKSVRVTRSIPVEGQEPDGNVMIEVADMGTDDVVRQELIDSNPKWLQSKADPEFFLRQKVRISVYTRLDLKIITDKKIGKTIVVKPRSIS